MTAFSEEIDRRAETAAPKVVKWRRDIHQHPELGYQEVRTSKLVAEHLKSLGMEVKTDVLEPGIGVLGVLKGDRPGPVVALRAELDALPVTEETDVPFKSTVKAQYFGREVGVMHACGHDIHTAMLMGAAEVLAGMRDRLPGTVKFIFQPSEEAPPPKGKECGARAMVEAGVLEKPKVDALFALHTLPMYESGVIAWRARGAMASADLFTITVTGKQTHAAMPWYGTDPIVAAAQITLGIQSLVSREMDLTTAPAIVSIGMIKGGESPTIIPNEVVMTGTIRSFDAKMQDKMHKRLLKIAQGIASSAGASAQLELLRGVPVTYNDPLLTDRMDATLKRVGGEKVVPDAPPITAAEDNAFYQQEVPGLYVWLGVTPKGQDCATAYGQHSPRFFADEAAFPTGVRLLANLAVDYMLGG
jgi:amidohydrolase